MQLAFRVTPQDVERCYEELKAKNIEIVQPPQVTAPRARQYWQHRMIFFKDPEGNLLEIYAEIEIPEGAE